MPSLGNKIIKIIKISLSLAFLNRKADPFKGLGFNTIISVKRMNSYHTPVMLDEVIQGLAIGSTGLYADVTFGGGGYARKIVESLDTGHLFAFDKDAEAAKIAGCFESNAFSFTRAPFRFVKEFLHFYGVTALDGLVADLGTSSHQIDTPDRGFSTRFDGNLDMRMDQAAPCTAQHIVANYTEAQLTNLLRSYGDVAEAFAISRAIVKARSHTPILTTHQLKAVIRPFAPKFKINQYFSKVFQAFRIEVNNELAELEWLLRQSVDLIKPNGRVVFVAYHSLEDRLIKNFLHTGNLLGHIEQDAYGNLLRPFVPLSRRSFTPSTEEIYANSRSRSARLRIGIRAV